MDNFAFIDMGVYIFDTEVLRAKKGQRKDETKSVQIFLIIFTLIPL